MTATVAVITPVLRRPHRVAPLLASLQEATEAGAWRLVFVADPDDDAEIAAIRDAGLEPLICAGSYARKINAAYAATDEPWLFLGADDLEFHAGWLPAALAAIGLRKSIGVIGTNDLANPRVMRGAHATHSLVARWYADQRGTIDKPGAILHEGYAHNFCDDELLATARSRGAYRFARRSHVRHLHPNFVEGVARDEVYELGQASFDDDHATFRQRLHLWR